MRSNRFLAASFAGLATLALLASCRAQSTQEIAQDLGIRHERPPAVEEYLPESSSVPSAAQNADPLCAAGAGVIGAYASFAQSLDLLVPEESAPPYSQVDWKEMTSKYDAFKASYDAACSSGIPLDARTREEVCGDAHAALSAYADDTTRAGAFMEGYSHCSSDRAAIGCAFVDALYRAEDPMSEAYGPIKSLCPANTEIPKVMRLW